MATLLRDPIDIIAAERLCSPGDLVIAAARSTDIALFQLALAVSHLFDREFEPTSAPVAPTTPAV
jgi:hypothetical protein